MYNTKTIRGFSLKPMMTALCCACALGVDALSAAQAETMEQMDTEMKAMTITGSLSDKDGHMMLPQAMTTGEMKANVKADIQPTSYDLVGADLNAHVGHKIELRLTQRRDVAADQRPHG